VSPASHFSFDGVVEVVAHRGFSARAPENTLSALRLALDTGADAVEFDLQTACDGTPVVLHDETVDRTTNGTGFVGALGLDSLRDLDAGRWFGGAFAGEPLPTLFDALDLLAGSNTRIYAEIKPGREPAHLRTIAELVRLGGHMERTVFISLEWSSLDAIREHEPRALVGYIVEDAARARAAFERSTGDDRALLDFDARILLADPSLARRAASAAIPLATWTVDTVEAASQLLAMGVPRIATNRVDLLVEWKRTL